MRVPHTLYAVVLFAIVPTLLLAKDQKQYSLKIKFISTVPVANGAAPNVQTQTSCSPMPGTNQVNCNSVQRTAGTHYTFVSTVEVSDGNTYDVVCRAGAGRAFLAGAGQGMAS